MGRRARGSSNSSHLSMNVETRQRRTYTDQECARQCIMEGYYICDYWTWDYDTENCQWFNGQYELTFNPDTKHIRCRNHDFWKMELHALVGMDDLLRCLDV